MKIWLKQAKCGTWFGFVLIKWILRAYEDLLGSPVFKTPHPTMQRAQVQSLRETKILHAAWYSLKYKTKPKESIWNKPKCPSTDEWVKKMQWDVTSHKNE